MLELLGFEIRRGATTPVHLPQVLLPTQRLRQSPKLAFQGRHVSLGPFGCTRLGFLLCYPRAGTVAAGPLTKGDMYVQRKVRRRCALSAFT